VSTRTRPPLDREAHADAAWTLVRWIGIPLILVAALYFVQRALDDRAFVVVTDRGVMPSPAEIAASKPGMRGQPLQPSQVTPLVPPAVAPSPPVAPLSDPVVALEALEQPAPIYPERALQAEKEGVVRLRLSIAPDGSISRATVLSAEPPGWFERAAQEGVGRWRYEPSENGGTAVVDVEFKLK
jgi:TonB family protein